MTDNATPRPGTALFPKAEAALRAIGSWGYPERALHHTHRRFFHRHGLIEAHSPGRVRITEAGRAAIASAKS